MGYYGLGPGMRVADKLTPLEQALRNMPAENAIATLEILEKLMKNVSQNPKEEKFRKIRLTNPTIAAKITSIPAALQVLLLIGWELDPSTVEQEPSLILTAEKKITFPDHVNKIIDAKDFYRKENEKERVAKGLSRVAPAGEQTNMPDPRDQATIEKLTQAGLKYVKETKKIIHSDL